MCSFVKISVSKMRKNRSLVGVLCNNPRANGKKLLGLCGWNQVDANLQVDLQKHIIAAALTEHSFFFFFGFDMWKCV